jgi:hypothetical protein
MAKWSLKQQSDKADAERAAKAAAREAREAATKERKAAAAKERRAAARKKRRAAARRTVALAKYTEKYAKKITAGKNLYAKEPKATHAQLRAARKAAREATRAQRAEAACERAKAAQRQWVKDHPEVRKAWLAAHPHYKALYRLGYRVLAEGMTWPSAEQTETILRLQGKNAAS